MADETRYREEVENRLDRDLEGGLYFCTNPHGEELLGRGLIG